MTDGIAHFNNISHRYDQYRALDQVEFLLPRTGVVGLLGLNGAGKTTTMNLLCGVLTPTEGRVVIDGHSMKLDPTLCKQLIGYAPDRPPLYPDCSVTEYLHYAAGLRLIPRKHRQQAVERVLQSIDIKDHAHKLCGQLSHGYRQRLNLAQAIIHSPPLIVLDEPTSGLDPAQIESVRALIRELSQSACVLISTHLLFEAQNLCQRVLIVHSGKVIEDVAAGGGSSRTPRFIMRFAVQAATGEEDGGEPEWLSTMQQCPALTEVRLEDNSSLSAQLAWPDEPKRARSELLSFVVDKGLDLSEIFNDEDDLEKRFLALTRDDQPSDDREHQSDGADEFQPDEANPDGAQPSNSLEQAADKESDTAQSTENDRSFAEGETSDADLVREKE